MTSPPQPPSPQIIQSYGSGGFTIAGMRQNGPVVVLRHRTLPWTPPADFNQLTAAHFAAVLDPAAEVSIVLLGCGPRAMQVGAALRAELRAGGLTVEPMDSGAACRTFNLLLLEGRHVAAMLVPLP